MTGVFYRDITKSYPKAVKSSGMYIFDENGTQYLDMSGGAAVSSVGHSHPYVISALNEQIKTMAFAHTAFFSNEPQEKLAEHLNSKFSEKAAKTYFTSGGTEANETAFKITWQYWRALGKNSKKKIISRVHSYHGNTYGALSISGNPSRRRVMGDLLLDWPRIDPCYAYRYKNEHETEEEYGIRSANQLEDIIIKEGADNIAALIADEIMCGSGRTGTFFAHEQDGFLPDIVTLAKGIAGGYQPLAATIVKGKIHQTLVDSGKGFDHGHTYVGHASACSAGLAVMIDIENDNLLKNVQEKGETLQQALMDNFKDYPYIGNIRGRGLCRGIEFVADKETKRPFPDEEKITRKLKHAVMENSLICYPGGGSFQDNIGSHLLIAPPYIIQDEHIDEFIGKLKTIFKEVFNV